MGFLHKWFEGIFLRIQKMKWLTKDKLSSPKTGAECVDAVGTLLGWVTSLQGWQELQRSHPSTATASLGLQQEGKPGHIPANISGQETQQWLNWNTSKCHWVGQIVLFHFFPAQSCPCDRDTNTGKFLNFIFPSSKLSPVRHKSRCVKATNTSAAAGLAHAQPVELRDHNSMELFSL